MELDWYLNLVDITLAYRGGQIWLMTEGGEGMSISEKDLNQLLVDYYNENF